MDSVQAVSLSSVLELVPATEELDVLKERVEELEGLYGDSLATAEAFVEAVKETAERCGLAAKVVRQFIVARVREQTQDRRRECDQLCLLFDEIPS